MKVACGLLVVALLVVLVSAGPLQTPDFGKRVQLALSERGVTLEKLPQFKNEDVGDIWSNCGKYFLLL